MSTTSDDIVLAVFLPPETLSSLPAQPIIRVQVTPGTPAIEPSILAFPAQVSSPQAIQTQFATSKSVAQIVVDPAAVFITKFEPARRSLPDAVYIGSRYPAQVEIGSQRVIAWLPVIGRFFTDQDRN